MEPDAADTFGRIYETDEWSGGSGVGSTPDSTATYRQVLGQLVGAPDVRSVVDVGCGDWQVGSLVDWSGVGYVGIDVVPAIVQRNRERFANPDVRFEVADARVDALPGADLLVAKDVLQHWPRSDISGFLRATLRQFRYVLLTNDISSVHWPGNVNEDIDLGGWRTLDLEAPPFLEPAAWRTDYPVRDEWTKRMVLHASRRARLATRAGRRTALRAVRSIQPLQLR